MLQLRLYALYKRSNKILGFMTVLFLAEVSAHLYIYIDFDSTVQGWPDALTLSEMFDPFDSYKPTITGGIRLWFNVLRTSLLWRVSDSHLRVGSILLVRLGRLSAFKGELCGF